MVELFPLYPSNTSFPSGYARATANSPDHSVGRARPGALRAVIPGQADGEGRAKIGRRAFKVTRVGLRAIAVDKGAEAWQPQG